jgi:hypothetical protein
MTAVQETNGTSGDSNNRDARTGGYNITKRAVNHSGSAINSRDTFETPESVRKSTAVRTAATAETSTPVRITTASGTPATAASQAILPISRPLKCCLSLKFNETGKIIKFKFLTVRLSIYV